MAALAQSEWRSVPRRNMPTLRRDITEDERWHLEQGSLTLVPCQDKLRFCDLNDWLRLKVDIKALLWRLRGEMFAKAKLQAGEHLMLVYVRPMGALVDVPVRRVYNDVSNYLRDKCDTDFPSSYLSFQFSCLGAGEPALLSAGPFLCQCLVGR